MSGVESRASGPISATLLLHEGVPPKAVWERLGHAITETNDGHLLATSSRCLSMKQQEQTLEDSSFTEGQQTDSNSSKKALYR